MSLLEEPLIPRGAGTMGISTTFHGFEPLKDYRGKPDIFGRKLKYTRVNIVDALAAMSSLLMGEGSEKTPLLLVRALRFIQFTGKNTTSKLKYPPKIDIYKPLLKIYRKNLKR